MNDTLSNAALSSIAIAQLATPTPGELFAWLGCLACAVMIAEKAITFWQRITGRFQERESGVQYRARPDCIEIHKTVNREFKELDKIIEDKTTKLRLEIKQDLAAMSLQLTHITELIGALRYKVERPNG